jgi:hypothetical protein
MAVAEVQPSPRAQISPPGATMLGKVSPREGMPAVLPCCGPVASRLG